MNERDVPISWNMPPIYDLILEQDGELLIQMVEGIEASDACVEAGQTKFPYRIHGVICKGKQQKITKNITK